MQENNTGSVSELALKGLEIAEQEARATLACGKAKPLNFSDLVSVANESIGIFFHKYPGAGEADLALLRLIIRGDFKNAVRKERRQARGVEVPDQRRDPAYDVVDYDEMVHRGADPADADLLRRYYINGEPGRQIAASLGVSKMTISRRLEVAKQNVQKILRAALLSPPQKTY